MTILSLFKDFCAKVLLLFRRLVEEGGSNCKYQIWLLKAAPSLKYKSKVYTEMYDFFRKMNKSFEQKSVQRKNVEQPKYLNKLTILIHLFNRI